MTPSEYWQNNRDLRHLTPVDNRFPEIGLFAALRDACAGSVFELGCGDGRLSPAFEPGRYCGYDINPAALETARANNPRHRYAEDWQEADTILAYTVLLHVPDEAVEAIMERMATYKRVVIGEIIGRKWRTPGDPPVFNRELSEYEATLGPAKRVIDVPYPHYKTSLSLCVWE